jgi:chitinase
VNVYPDQDPAGWPGTNFGNACGSGVYTNSKGTTELLSGCAAIGAGITACQAAGKKVLLSIGGAAPGNGYFKSSASPAAFADFLWGAFGPQQQAWVNSGKPRPFGSASVDGFDFDIESTFATNPSDSPGNAENYGYDLMINELRSLYAASGGTYYISGAPQCIIPDAHLNEAITRSWFDFIFVQLYNTPECSARAAVNGNSAFPLTDWTAVVATNPNPNVRIYMGLVGLLCVFLDCTNLSFSQPVWMHPVPLATSSVRLRFMDLLKVTLPQFPSSVASCCGITRMPSKTRSATMITLFG